MRHQVHYTHTRPITLVVLTNSSSIFFFSPSSGPDRNLDQTCRQMKPEGNVASGGRSRWRALVAMSHLVVEHRPQLRADPSDLRVVMWQHPALLSVVPHFYCHVIVLSIGQMKCSLYHKSFKLNFCIFDKAVFCVLTVTFFVSVTTRRQQMRLINNHFHE